MNAGGVATVLQQPHCSQNPVVGRPTNAPNIPGGSVMTCDNEMLSAAQKSQRERFLGSLEVTKRIADQARQRQEMARPEILRQQRQEMEKYHRRYMEQAMKQHMEQQAKSQQQVRNDCTQQMAPYNRFAPAPGAPVAQLSTPTSAVLRHANRKRPHEQPSPQVWHQHPQMMCQPMVPGMPPNMAPFNGQMHMGFGSQPQVMQTPPMAATSSEVMRQQRLDGFQGHHPGTIQPKVESRGDPSTMNGSIPEVSCDQVVINGDSKPSLPSCSAGSGTSSGNGIDQSSASIPEYAVLNLMGPFSQDKLSDLGDKCFEGVLNGQNDDDQQPSTSGAGAVVSELVTNSPIISPVSVSSHTPNEGPQSAQSVSMSVSGNSSVCSARMDPSTPQQSVNGAFNAMGTPLCSSTPSSSSSCCYSQMAPSSVMPANGASLPSPSSGVHRNRVQYPNFPQGHPQMIPPQFQQYSCMMESDGGVLTRMQERFNDPAADKRHSTAAMSGFPPRSFMATPQSANYEPQFKAAEAAQRMAAVNNQRAMHYRSQGVNAEQMHQMTAAAGGQMFPGQYPMQTPLQGNRPMYGYPMGMHSMSQQQMAMYQMNGQMAVSHPQYASGNNGYMQAAPSPYFPARSVNYPYS